MKIIDLIILRFTLDTKMTDIFVKQITSGNDYIWNTPEDHEEEVRKLFVTVNAKELVVVGHDKNTHEIEKIWIGKCRLVKHTYKINLENIFELSHDYKDIFIALYSRLFGNSLINDLMATRSFLVYRQVNSTNYFRFLNEYYKSKPFETIEGGDYKTLSVDHINTVTNRIEKDLHPLAQKSLYAKRPLGYSPPDSNRTEFQRDKERIIHSKAYRRLVDKAQIFTSSKGDHYRTRLTHTLEVAQIAKGIARVLNLNEDLTEAIALGHDLGHTPFGHEGERELHSIMTGKVCLDKKHDPIYLGGFKHNYQGIRMAHCLEEKYIHHQGLDLTYQVLEGILKHTKFKKCKPGERNCPECKDEDKCYELDQFVQLEKNKLYLDYDHPSTLEGQVVFWADEIAQRSHDLDDGISCGVIDVNELIESFSGIECMSPITDSIAEIRKGLNATGRAFVDKKDVERAVIVSNVIRILIQALIDNSKIKMEEYVIRYPVAAGTSELTISERVIEYNDSFNCMLNTLENLISSKVINSEEINCFDGKAAFIIRKLFKAYYQNPRQLPDTTINRIEREIRLHTSNVTNIRRGNKAKIENEIKIYKGQSKNDENVEENLLKHRIFMRCIADMISGMTDDYANSQYIKLYMP